MSLDSEWNAPVIESLDDLIGYFRAAEAPPEQVRVGIEYEKLPFFTRDLAPVPYEGGIHDVLQRLRRYGWRPAGALAPLVALERGESQITLEPGGQFEHASAPQRNLHLVAEEVARHTRELVEVGAELGVGFSTLGFRPFESTDDMPWMPKARYRVMREYLPTRGGAALEMMLLSATVQASFDFTSEADMADKVRCAMAVSPIVAAMFANSPFVRGAWHGRRSRRYAMWRDVDPDRCGLLPFVFDDDFGYRRYVEWALDVPMFFLRRGGKYLDVGHMSFRRFLEEGFAGERANGADFVNHLSTLFPEVRLKRFIEVRSADCAPAPLALALAALWKGLLYDVEARSAASALTSSLSFAELEAMQIAVAQDGLRARGPGYEALELARELVRLARRGLSRHGERNARGEDESCYLAPLEVFLDAGETLADRAVARFGAGPWDEATRRRILLESVLSEASVAALGG